MALLHGLHAQAFPQLILPCFSEVLWRPTVCRYQLKNMLASHGCVGLCVPLWAKAHCTRCFPSLIDEYYLVKTWRVGPRVVRMRLFTSAL